MALCVITGAAVPGAVRSRQGHGHDRDQRDDKREQDERRGVDRRSHRPRGPGRDRATGRAGPDGRAGRAQPGADGRRRRRSRPPRGREDRRRRLGRADRGGGPAAAPAGRGEHDGRLRHHGAGDRPRLHVGRRPLRRPGQRRGRRGGTPRPARGRDAGRQHPGHRRRIRRARDGGGRGETVRGTARAAPGADRLRGLGGRRGRCRRRRPGDQHRGHPHRRRAPLRRRAAGGLAPRCRPQRLTFPDRTSARSAGVASGELVAARAASGAPFVTATSSLAPSTPLLRAVVPALGRLLSVPALRRLAVARLGRVTVKAAPDRANTPGDTP